MSRAKSLTSVKKETAGESYHFEIEGEIESKNVIGADVTTETAEPKKSKNIKLLLRNKPSVKDFEREKALKKIATKGVVQLFNAIRMQQKDLTEQIKEAGPLDHKRDAVLQNINKKKFLNVLMGGERSKSEQLDIDTFRKQEDGEDSDDHSTTNKKKCEWNVLSDDFMTDKRLKNWDQGGSDDADSIHDESDLE